MSSLLWFLIIGAVIGFIAGLIMRGSGFGIFGNMVVGIIGSVLGSYIFDYFNVSLGTGLLGYIITGVIGSVVLLFIIGLFTRRR